LKTRSEVKRRNLSKFFVDLKEIKDQEIKPSFFVLISLSIP